MTRTLTEAARDRIPEVVKALEAAQEVFYGARDRFYRDLEDIGLTSLQARQVVALATGGSGSLISAASVANRDAYEAYGSALHAARNAIRQEAAARRLVNLPTNL